MQIVVTLALAGLLVSERHHAGSRQRAKGEAAPDQRGSTKYAAEQADDGTDLPDRVEEVARSRLG